MIELKKPPMGWNSYDYYDTTVNEEQVRANADYMAQHLKPYGWEYVVVDIAWYSYEAGQDRDRHQYVPFCKVEMDEYSRLLPCPTRFPSSAGGKGFAPLAEYIHSMGLKFGIHIMRGIPRVAAYKRTKIKGTSVTANEIADPYSICWWNPDMYGVKPGVPGAKEYYHSIVELYASWGVDFIKCDDICRMDATSSKEEIAMLSDAIDRSGRDMVLSLSPGPAIVAEDDFYHKYANMWRITDDLWDNWASIRAMFDRCKAWEGRSHDGGYPDCDMLPMGRIGGGFGDERPSNLTFEEQKSMMTLWCIFGSPLMLGAELTMLDERTLSLLCQDEVLHLLELGDRAVESYRDKTLILWETEDVESSAKYVAVFNLSATERRITPLKKDQMVSDPVKEIWRDIYVNPEEEITIAGHGCALLRYPSNYHFSVVNQV